MAEQSTDALRNEINQLREDVRRITNTLKEVTASTGEETVEQMRERLGRAKEQAVEAERSVKKQVEEHPLTSVLTAFVGGLIAGLLLHSRR
ncbi:hypothetical protein [Aquisalimonas sp.]|uniref:DUF883 family protein n=1 Tax=Aquisalimonas sp. TaxID=1872621 RepID=UPI0025C429A8|nr:hypothetical protein [Aquisalimonas sp.]